MLSIASTICDRISIGGAGYFKSCTVSRVFLAADSRPRQVLPSRVLSRILSSIPAHGVRNLWSQLRAQCFVSALGRRWKKREQDHPPQPIRKHGLGDSSHPRARDNADWPKYITNLPAIVTIHFQLIESRNSAG